MTTLNKQNETPKTRVAIIIAGGIGSRLWPYSTFENPKQLATGLIDEGCLLGSTLSRFGDNYFKIVVTNIAYKKHMTEFANMVDMIIYEQHRKNTASAILFPIFILKKIYPDKMLQINVFPSDHYFDKKNFATEILNVEYTYDKIITFGIKPTYPETGYGYIKDTNGHIDKFIEKPGEVEAKNCINNGFYWNCGIFSFNDVIIIEEYDKYMFDMSKLCQLIINDTDVNNLKNIIINNNGVQNISFDKAIMEKTKRGYIIKTDIEWIDLGDWRKLYAFNSQKCDDNGNIIECDNCSVHGTTNCYIKTGIKEVVVVGINNVCVIEKNNKLLIANMDMLNIIQSK